jgi:hypothetical protein
MSDEFCAGVKILLKRMESNPDEFINPNEYRWQTIASGVFARKQGRADSEGAGAVRGLTDAEVDALHAGFVKLSRPAFDEYVMKTVLNESETERQDTINAAQAWQMTQGRRAIAGGSAGSGLQVQIKPESVMSKIKKELGL